MIRTHVFPTCLFLSRAADDGPVHHPGTQFPAPPHPASTPDPPLIRMLWWFAGAVGVSDGGRADGRGAASGAAPVQGPGGQHPLHPRKDTRDDLAQGAYGVSDPSTLLSTTTTAHTLLRPQRPPLTPCCVSGVTVRWSPRCWRHRSSPAWPRCRRTLTEMCASSRRRPSRPATSSAEAEVLHRRSAVRAAQGLRGGDSCQAEGRRAWSAGSPAV